MLTVLLDFSVNKSSNIKKKNNPNDKGNEKMTCKIFVA